MLRSLLCLSLVLGGFAARSSAAEDTKKEEKTIKSQLANGKQTCCRASTINFAKELGVPLDYLESIGQRIHQARRTPDPVELALAAQALGVAEKVANKKASLTADDCMKEAVELAKMRGNSAELAAVSLLASDETTKKDLGKELALATKRESEEKAALKSGESTRQILGTLTVINHTGECLDIYVSGNYVGRVHTGQVRTFYVHDHNYHSHLDAYCVEGGELVREACAEGHRHNVTWHID